jgi:hypothetical protein
MTTVFISGSMQIKNLDVSVKNRINNILTSKFEIIVGDADGVDSSIQKFLLERKATSVTVYCSGPQPRNNIGSWPVKRIDTKFEQGTRAFFTAKDLRMADDADFGLMIWDTKSTGTLSNVIELLNRKKKSVVFINKVKDFLNICKADDLEKLIGHMSEAAFLKADAKIGLKKRIDSLKYEQISLFKMS